MPKCNVNDFTTEGWRAEVSWRVQDDQFEGHVQVASVNTGSTLELPGDLLNYGPNGEELRGEPEPFVGWRVTLDAAGIDRMIAALVEAKKAAFPNQGTRRTFTAPRAPLVCTESPACPIENHVYMETWGECRRTD